MNAHLIGHLRSDIAGFEEVVTCTAYLSRREQSLSRAESFGAATDAQETLEFVNSFKTVTDSRSSISFCVLLRWEIGAVKNDIGSDAKAANSCQP